MLTEIVEATTTDGIPLSGAYFRAESRSNVGIDAFIYFHGDGGNFYSRLLLQLGEMFASQGVSFLAANRRGHDLVSSGVRGGPLKGYAFESVQECIEDYAAWIDLLGSKGYHRIAIGGHSGGAVRATYAAANRKFQNVIAVVSVSPGEYNHINVKNLHETKFADVFREAQKAIADDNPDVLIRPGIPWGSTWSARAFVDCFNEDNRYSVSVHAEFTGLPTLYVFGGKECDVGGEEELPVCGLAMRTLSKLSYPHTDIQVVEGANHGYLGREQELMSTIYNFFETI